MTIYKCKIKYLQVVQKTQEVGYMDMDTIGVIAVLLLVVSSAALITKNKKKKDGDDKE